MFGPKRKKAKQTLILLPSLSGLSGWEKDEWIRRLRGEDGERRERDKKRGNETILMSDTVKEQKRRKWYGGP